MDVCKSMEIIFGTALGAGYSVPSVLQNSNGLFSELPLRFIRSFAFLLV